MRERPILFSAPMVRAILEGRKTVTRRVVKPQPELLTVSNDVPFGKAGHRSSIGWAWRGEQLDQLGEEGFLARCPYGQPGDRLWVREAWRVPISLDDLSGKQIAEKCLAAGYRTPWCPIQYEADGARTSEKDWREFGPHPSTQQPGRYRHARFMPRWASRITLEVTGVRVERLQDISEADALAEGVDPAGPVGYIPASNRMGRCRYQFANLWDEINGTGSWDANPFVWVVEFKRVKP